MRMDRLRQQIEAYEPYNEQEVSDKELFLAYIDKYGEELLTRDNGMVHLTSSNWIVNREHTKALMVYHNIYQSWAWTGGHADGEADPMVVARKEAEEETGIQNLKPLVDGIYTIEILTVNSHIKRGKFVSAHLHLDCCFLWEADEAEALRMKEDENSGVQWIDIDKSVDAVKEEHMKPIYQKLNDKLLDIK